MFRGIFLTSVLKEFRELLKAISEIKTVYSLAALIIVALVTVVVYLTSFPSAPLPTAAAVLIFEVGLFLVLVILARKIPPPSLSPFLPEISDSSDSSLERNNLSVSLPIWENLEYCLRQLGFASLEREKRIPILNSDYHFSWAEHDSSKLLFLQLTPREFTVPNLRKIHSIMRIDLPILAKLNVTGYGIICDTETVSDACMEYLDKLEEPLKCICFTNYSLTQIRHKDEIGVTHLRAKLSPCAIC